jgi:hypothetical protein
MLSNQTSLTMMGIKVAADFINTAMIASPFADFTCFIFVSMLKHLS